MTNPRARHALRLWPGIALAALLVIVRGIAPYVIASDQIGLAAMMGGLALAVAIVLWWLFFSRAAWIERLGAVALMAAALALTPALLHPSVSGGMMGLMFFLYAIPTLGVALVLWAVATRRFADWVRRATLVAAIASATGVWALVRTDGIVGSGSDLHWRWTPTAEARLLAQGVSDPLPPAPPAPEPAPAPAPPTAADVIDAPSEAEPSPASLPSPVWPGFRGPARDSVISGVPRTTDWSASPPVALWRRTVGPGWGSFAVAGDMLYTQEQLGDDEVVSAYRVSTGEPVWRHRDAVRFWESNAGAGPRSTPAVSGGRVYSAGATGIVNALDAATGAVIWSRNLGEDAARNVPTWGFSSSPLVVGDLVIASAAGRLVAYERGSGEVQWQGPDGIGGYSSPQRMVIDDVPQIVHMNARGAVAVDPVEGAVLWQHEWKGSPIVQPALMPGGDLIVSTSDMNGGVATRRLAVRKQATGWTVDERWTSRGLKPYFNDFVVHEGHAYGFDGSILACINLADGARAWKGGRYGNGQMLLLADHDLLLVVSEDGELALVNATPDRFTERAKVPALDGKTWNHPVLVGDTLLVRNGQEMAAFRLR